MLEVTFRLRSVEAAAAMRAVVLSQRVGKVLIWLAWSALVLPVLLAAVKVIPFKAATVPIGMGTGVLAIFWLVPLAVVLITGAKSTGAKHPQSYAFDHTGIAASGFGASSKSSWSSLTRVVESTRFLIFFVSGTAAWVIPKRHLSSQDLTALRGLISEHVGTSVGAQAQDVVEAEVGDVRFRAEFEWTRKSLYKASMAIHRHTPKLWIYAFVAAYLALFVAPGYLSSDARARFSPLAFVLQIMPVVLILLAGPAASWLWARRHLRAPSVATGRQEIILGTDGLILNGPTSKSIFSWSAFWRVVETREFFLFFLSKAAAIPIPKDAFETAMHHEIRAMLQVGASGKFWSV